MSLCGFTSLLPIMGSTPGHWRTIRHEIEFLKQKLVLGISQAGGSADLASKAQILAYYELVLADLKVTVINSNIINISITIMVYPQVTVLPNFKITFTHLPAKLFLERKIKILNMDNLPSGHRQADMAASLRVQGQRQSCLTHTSRQGDAGTSQTAFYFLDEKRERKISLNCQNTTHTNHQGLRCRYPSICPYLYPFIVSILYISDVIQPCSS